MLIRYSLAAKALATCLVASPAYAPVYHAVEAPQAGAASAPAVAGPTSPMSALAR